MLNKYFAFNQIKHWFCFFWISKNMYFKQKVIIETTVKASDVFFETWCNEQTESETEWFSCFDFVRYEFCAFFQTWHWLHSMLGNVIFDHDLQVRDLLECWAFWSSLSLCVIRQWILSASIQTSKGVVICVRPLQIVQTLIWIHNSCIILWDQKPAEQRNRSYMLYHNFCHYPNIL